MSISVTLARPGILPNYPDVCEDVKRKAIEMGIKEDIVIDETDNEKLACASSAHKGYPVFDLEFRYKRIRIPLGTWPRWHEIDMPNTIILPYNFPCGYISHNEIVLRHELAHLLHKDATRKVSTIFSRFKINWILGAFGLGLFANDLMNNFFSSDPTPLTVGVLCLWVSSYVISQIDTAWNDHCEELAEKEAIKYLSIEDKIKAINFNKKRNAELSWFQKVNNYFFDNHPSENRRIQMIKDSFTEEEKSRYQEL